MHLQDRDNSGKLVVIPDETTVTRVTGVKEAGPFEAACLLSGLRLISLMVGSRPTMAMISSRPERVFGHTGTETLSRLLREAAVANHSQWTKV